MGLLFQFIIMLQNLSISLFFNCLIYSYNSRLINYKWSKLDLRANVSFCDFIYIYQVHQIARQINFRS